MDNYQIFLEVGSWPAQSTYSGSIGEKHRPAISFNLTPGAGHHQFKPLYRRYREFFYLIAGDCRKLAHSMPYRMKELLKNNGGYISY